MSSRILVVWAALATGDVVDHLVRDEAARWLDVDEAFVRLVRLCPACGSSRHGRPLLAPVPGLEMPHVSVSRAGQVGVVALCDAGAVGVDVEPVGAAGFAGFRDVALHPSEPSEPSEPSDTVRGRTVTWVRKESLLKATGHGLGVDPRLVRLTDPAEPPAVVAWQAPRPPAQVWMADIVTAPGHVAAVTVLTGEPLHLVVRRATRAARSREANR